MVNGKTRPYYDTPCRMGRFDRCRLSSGHGCTRRTGGKWFARGVQIVGPYLEDRTPIHFAGLLADITGGFQPPPGY
ncbi:MAG: hypothetical protein R2874_07690 [Desulfobacterales bacterium]